MPVEWKPPADFGERMTSTTVEQAVKFYGVTRHTIRRHLKKQSGDIIERRKAFLKDLNVMNGRRVGARNLSREAGSEPVAIEPQDPLLTRYIEVAARNGWRVWGMAA